MFTAELFIIIKYYKQRKYPLDDELNMLRSCDIMPRTVTENHVEKEY